MAGEAIRLYQEAGGLEYVGIQIPPDYEQRRADQAAYRILPSREDIDEAAAMILARKDEIEARFGISAWQAFVHLSNRSFKDRLPIVPVTERFLAALN